MASQLGHRLFRHNVGLGWVGKSTRYSEATTVKVMPGDVLIRQARPLHAGLIEGGSDTIGWTVDGRFLAIETKTIDGKTDKERLIKQTSFINAINKAGGVAGFARTEEEGFELLNG